MTTTSPVVSFTVTFAGSITCAPAGIVALTSAGISASVAVANFVPSGAVASAPVASLNVGVTGSVSLAIVPVTAAYVGTYESATGMLAINESNAKALFKLLVLSPCSKIAAVKLVAPVISLGTVNVAGVATPSLSEVIVCASPSATPSLNH